MKVSIVEATTGEKVEAVIETANFQDMPLKRNGWNFNWRTLFKTEGAEFYTLRLNGQEGEIEGIVMLTLMNEEMMYMNNIEVSPQNYGSNGKYENVAGALLAFACLKSIEKGKDAYEGYLTFESKTTLIDFYIDTYGATLAIGKRMFIDPNAGRRLVNKYLEKEI